jgi:two-component system chemotaxis response regulator CheB
MAEVKVVRHRRPASAVSDAGARPVMSAPGSPARVVAIAASTGGPAALHTILSTLPPGYRIPILVVQHIAGGFVDGLASWLDSASNLTVTVARDGDELRPGWVYIAPDDHHLGLASQSAIRLSNGPRVEGFRPSATYLFREAARVFGSSTLAVVLTGMGSDGLGGLADVRGAGGRIIAQDEQTSVVYGMPGAAVEAGLADASIGLWSIAERLEEVAE